MRIVFQVDMYFHLKQSFLMSLATGNHTNELISERPSLMLPRRIVMSSGHLVISCLYKNQLNSMQFVSASRSESKTLASYCIVTVFYIQCLERTFRSNLRQKIANHIFQTCSTSFYKQECGWGAKHSLFLSQHTDTCVKEQFVFEYVIIVCILISRLKNSSRNFKMSLNTCYSSFQYVVHIMMSTFQINVHIHMKS